MSLTGDVIRHYQRHIPETTHADILDYCNGDSDQRRKLKPSIDVYRYLIDSFRKAYVVARDFDAFVGQSIPHYPEEEDFLQSVDQLEAVLSGKHEIGLKVVLTYTGNILSEDWIDNDTSVDEVIEMVKSDEWVRQDLIDDLGCVSPDVQVEVIGTKIA